MGKKSFTLFCLLLTSFLLKAQDERDLTFFENKGKGKDKNQIIKLNPLLLFYGTGSISIEGIIDNKSSFVFNPSYGNFKRNNSLTTSLGLGIGYKYYFKEKAPKGWYANPNFIWSIGTVDVEFSNRFNNYSIRASAYALQLLVGHQFILKNGLSIDLSAGAQYVKYNNLENSSLYQEELKNIGGFYPYIGVGIGYAF